MSHASADQLAILARVALLREDRAQRALRAATEESARREAAETHARRMHETAQGRAAEARGRAMADPASDAAWVWRAAMRAASDRAGTASVEASDARSEAERDAAQCRDDWSRSHSRTGAVEDRASRARRDERSAQEAKDADDAASPVGVDVGVLP